jgi:hypothetical protein
MPDDDSHADQDHEHRRAGTGEEDRGIAQRRPFGWPLDQRDARHAIAPDGDRRRLHSRHHGAIDGMMPGAA